MFAFALWDQRAQKLILARDRLGKKPLFVAQHGDGTLSFASELGSLLLDDRIGREVDQQALAEYLQYGYVPSPRTILARRRQARAGDDADLGADRAACERSRYWQLDFEPKHRL